MNLGLLSIAFRAMECDTNSTSIGKLASNVPLLRLLIESTRRIPKYNYVLMVNCVQSFFVIYNF